MESNGKLERVSPKKLRKREKRLEVRLQKAQDARVKAEERLLRAGERVSKANARIERLEEKLIALHGLIGHVEAFAGESETVVVRVVSDEGLTLEVEEQLLVELDEEPNAEEDTSEEQPATGVDEEQAAEDTANGEQSEAESVTFAHTGEPQASENAAYAEEQSATGEQVTEDVPATDAPSLSRRPGRPRRRRKAATGEVLGEEETAGNDGETPS
jgi:cobalamin biosynthesis protein CobT